MDIELTKQPFHRMPSERRRKLWSLAARAGAKCPDDQDKGLLQTKPLTGSQLKESDSLAKTQDSGVSMDLNSDYQAQSTSIHYSPFNSKDVQPSSKKHSQFFQQRTSLDNRSKYVQNPYIELITGSHGVTQSADIPDHQLINPNPFKQSQKNYHHYYMQKRKSDNIFTAHHYNPIHSYLPTQYLGQPHKYYRSTCNPRSINPKTSIPPGRVSFQFYQSTDTSGLGSSLDWASLELTHQQHKAFDLGMEDSSSFGLVHPQMGFRSSRRNMSTISNLENIDEHYHPPKSTNEKFGQVEQVRPNLEPYVVNSIRTTISAPCTPSHPINFAITRSMDHTSSKYDSEQMIDFPKRLVRWNYSPTKTNLKSNYNKKLIRTPSWKDPSITFDDSYSSRPIHNPMIHRACLDNHWRTIRQRQKYRAFHRNRSRTFDEYYYYGMDKRPLHYHMYNIPPPTELIIDQGQFNKRSLKRSHDMMNADENQHGGGVGEYSSKSMGKY